MPLGVWCGLLIPLAGTTLGAACVFLMQGDLSRNVERTLQGFAVGVMVAASIWSLMQPGKDGSVAMGRLAFVLPSLDSGQARS